jgi:putative nucleotide binding protein
MEEKNMENQCPQKEEQNYYKRDGKKEEVAFVLDYLPYGYPLENKMLPLAQAIGKRNLTLLQIVPRRGMTFELNEEVYIGDGKREKVLYILGRLPREKLTETAKLQLRGFVEKIVKENEKEFVDFFNKSQPINTRLHQLELLPGFGKKHMKAVIEEKERKLFESFEDIRNRVDGIPDPCKSIEKRIMEELTEIQRHNLFIA